MNRSLPEFLRGRIAGLELSSFRRAIIAYSGGLDSLLCIALARSVYHCDDLRVVIGDIGQPREIIDEAIQRTRGLGAGSPEVVDLTKDFFDHWLVQAIRANAVRDKYPMAAPIVKQLLGQKLGELAHEDGYEAVVDGTSSLGNDQFRFASSLAFFAPRVKQVSPVRELFLTREEEIELCETWELDYDRNLAMGGDDVTLWCRAIASGAFGPEDPLEDDVLRWVRPDAMEQDQIELEFEAGIPCALDGEAKALPDLIRELNDRVGRCGVGLVDIIEDNRLGLKRREIYEAPAAALIFHAKGELEALCLTAEERRVKSGWERQWMDLVYCGEAFHPLVEAVGAAIEVVQRRVSGKIVCQVRAGAMRTIERSSTHSLTEIRQYSSDSELPREIVELHRLRYRGLGELLRGNNHG